jgi:serine protease SohB
METLEAAGIALGLFAAKTFLILFAIIVVILVIALIAAKAQDKSELEIEHLHKRFKRFGQLLRSQTLSKSEKKAEQKKLKAENKANKDKSLQDEKKIFVVDFDGDVRASAVENLREEISAILSAATTKDEVVVRVESPGGVVHGYGLAAAQLLRVREHNIPLTVCVDKVAASGGYMMACTANKILSAPFAIVGSVGVVASVPNFHKVLKKHDVEYKEYTAGDYKRTVSILGEITTRGEEKFKEQLEATHVLFKNFVGSFRPQLDLQKVATGEYWYGEQAIALGLVDEIKTSDEYLVQLAKNHSVIKVTFKKHQSLSEKLSGAVGQAMQRAGVKLLQELETRRYL